MKCPDCWEKLMRLQAGWYCPSCNKLTDEPLGSIPQPQLAGTKLSATVDKALREHATSPIRRLFGFVALGVPLVFLILPQASCASLASGSFTGLALVQSFSGGGGTSGAMM